MNSKKIIADIRQMTSAITKEETTATPSKTRALQEARGHLIRASIEVRRAMADEDMPEIKVSAAVTMEYGHEMGKYVVI